MNKQKKQKQRGGYRKGAGRKKTGINNVHIGMSVPKKYADFIKEMVKSKIAELRGLENQSGKQIAAPKKAKEKETCMEAAKRISQSPSFRQAAKTKTNTDYLQKRRNAKLKIKEN